MHALGSGSKLSHFLYDSFANRLHLQDCKAETARLQSHHQFPIADKITLNPNTMSEIYFCLTKDIKENMKEQLDVYYRKGSRLILHHPSATWISTAN